VGNYSQKQLSIIMVESFPTKMVKNGYCCDVDTWLSLSTTISFSICIFQLLWSAIEKKNVIEKVIFNYNCKLQM
jgi:hypothetical protein